MVSLRTPLAADRRLTNDDIAQVLEEVARLLEIQAANPFRIGAYRRAAIAVRKLNRPLTDIVAEEGTPGLMEIEGIGKSLARSLEQLIRTGRHPRLDALRAQLNAHDVLTSLPGIGPETAERIREALGTVSLEELFAAAYDGRLRQIAGIGGKRLQTIRECLSLRLRKARPSSTKVDTGPSVALLLGIDREYREKAARGQLVTVSPQGFNPTGEAWLPILQTFREGHGYFAQYSNSARAHELEHAGDWVVIYRDDEQSQAHWTIITSRYGPLRGRRIVRGREAECLEHYRQRVQKTLPGTL